MLCKADLVLFVCVKCEWRPWNGYARIPILFSVEQHESECKRRQKQQQQTTL